MNLVDIEKRGCYRVQGVPCTNFNQKMSHVFHPWNRLPLDIFLSKLELPVTKGSLRAALSKEGVHWLGMKSSFRSNSTKWDQYVKWFEARIVD